jgi:hypothetical protein
VLADGNHTFELRAFDLAGNMADWITGFGVDAP